MELSEQMNMSEHLNMTEEEFDQYLNFVIAQEEDNFSFDLPSGPAINAAASTTAAINTTTATTSALTTTTTPTASKKRKLIDEQNEEFEFTLKQDQAVQRVQQQYAPCGPSKILSSSQLQKGSACKVVPLTNAHGSNCKCKEYKIDQEARTKLQPKYKTVTVGGHICRQYRDTKSS